MLIKNFYALEGEEKRIHEGQGLVRSVKLFDQSETKSHLKYVAYTSIPVGGAIGFHDHVSTREEVYVILSGHGKMTIDEMTSLCGPGDTILTQPGQKHGLDNVGDTPLEVFVFWVKA